VGEGDGEVEGGRKGARGKEGARATSIIYKVLDAMSEGACAREMRWRDFFFAVQRVAVNVRGNTEPTPSHTDNPPPSLKPKPEIET
jgi:hypothetical protein